MLIYECRFDSCSDIANVAQWIEHQTTNLKAAGSIPAKASKMVSLTSFGRFSA